MKKFVAVSIFTFFFWLGINGVAPLKNVQVIVPSAVTLGNHVTLTCLYDLDYNETLYTVKWYLDGEEFYRYVPKEVPPIQVFPLLGLDLDKSKSNAQNVLLRSVHHEQTGRYKCEVSADAPYFDTDIVSAQMTVVEFPENLPLIQVGKHRYEVGERIRANCSFGPSRPAANITWFINDVQVRGQFITEFPVSEDGSKKAWVKSALEMDTDAGSFRGGRLKLKCIAGVYSKYTRVSEVQIEEEKPRSASVMGSKDSAGKLNTPDHGSPVDHTGSTESSSTATHISVQLLFVHFPLSLMCWNFLSSSHEGRLR